MGARELVVRRRVLVSGHVQGVFFRESCRAEAERLEVSGTIENLPDGRVLGYFEGPASAVEALIAWSRVGPERSRVDSVEATEQPPAGASGFSVQQSRAGLD